ncbi:MAG TPA: hypothetical protein VL882_19615 [Vicinamibacterales bacterium]|jgi:hypothetical protein|nr:hypothetical protein [Vicinamibacterales bacterium]
MRVINVALFVAMFLFVSHLSGGLQAYLDPGTGSMAIQLLMGGVVALLATVRLYWDRMKTFFTRKNVQHDSASEIR